MPRQKDAFGDDFFFVCLAETIERKESFFDTQIDERKTSFCSTVALISIFFCVCCKFDKKSRPQRIMVCAPIKFLLFLSVCVHLWSIKICSKVKMQIFPDSNGFLSVIKRNSNCVTSFELDAWITSRQKPKKLTLKAPPKVGHGENFFFAASRLQLFGDAWLCDREARDDKVSLGAHMLHRLISRFSSFSASASALLRFSLHIQLHSSPCIGHSCCLRIGRRNTVK